MFACRICGAMEIYASLVLVANPKIPDAITYFILAGWAAKTRRGADLTAPLLKVEKWVD